MKAWLKSPRSVLSVISMLSAALLSGCAQPPSWDAYVSSTKTLRFVAFVPCGLIYSGVPNATYYHVVHQQKNADSGFRLWFYREPAGSLQWTNVFVTQSWQYGFRYSRTIDLSGQPQNFVGNCGVFVDLPWSDEIRRPYYMARDPNAVRAEYEAHRSLVVASLIGTVLALSACVFLAWFGFFSGEELQRTLCIAAVVGVSLISLLLAATAVFGPSEKLVATLDYYKFFDALPRNGGDLLPLPWEQAHRVFAGPPHPSQLNDVEFGSYFLGWGVLLAGWVFLYAGRIAAGVYYLTVRIPVVEARQWAEGEGRLLTPNELVAAALHGTAGKSEWQLKALRQKILRQIELMQRQAEPQSPPA